MRKPILFLLLLLSLSLPAWAGVDLNRASSENIGLGDVLDPQTGNGVTVFAVFNPDATGTRYEILSKEGSSTGYTLNYTTAQKIEFGCFDSAAFYNPNTYISSTNTAGSGAWSWAAGVWDDANNTISVFLNGTKTSKADTLSCVSNSTALKIGSSPGGTNYFDGKIAEVAIWTNKALSDSEIQSIGGSLIKLQSKNSASVQPDGCYPLDEMADGTSSNATHYDRCGNNNGTGSNTPTGWAEQYMSYR